MQVSCVDINFDQEDPMVIGIPQGESSSDSPYMLTIDGNSLHKKKKMSIMRIAVSRLLLKDGTQATVPIMTYLPLKEGDLKNQCI